MKTFLTFFFFIPFILYGQIAWSPPIAIDGTTIYYLDELYCYSDGNGNHIVINNGTIRYIRLDIDGEIIYERTIDTDCNYSADDIYTVAITGYQNEPNNEPYVVYQKGTKIKVAKSVDVGNTWQALTENDMESSNCDGINAVYDEKGLQVVWAVDYETYYERYRRNNPAWVEYKNVTDEQWVTGGRPSIALSENRIHVSFAYQYYICATRDYNFNTTEWEPSQFVFHETPPPPFPGWVVTDFRNWNGGQLAILDGYLHALEYILVTAEDQTGYDLFIYMCGKKRTVDNNEWETDVWFTPFILTQSIPPMIVNSGGKLHTLVIEFLGTINLNILLKNYNFYEDNWHEPSTIINRPVTELIYGLCFSGYNQSVYAYWSEFGTNGIGPLHFSYSLQNPIIPLEINPFSNKQHSFYDYEPEILSYSQQKQKIMR